MFAEEPMRKVYLFPGQGSQKKGMGQDVISFFPDLINKANQILGYSIQELCLEDSKNVLGQTQYTQPALYVVSALNYLKKINETGIKPDFTAGHSLGEYTALFASGVMDFETGLKLVQKRSELMSKVSDGGMSAIIGLTEKQVFAILEKHQLTGIDIANLNSPMQIVISGTKDLITQAESIFKNEGAKLYIPLQVSGAFHSRYMKKSAEEFSKFLDGFTFNEPSIPVISNVEARPYTKEKVKELLVKQITHSVKWTETIRYLMGKNVENFEEIGPGNVLTGLVTKIKKESTALVIDDTDFKKEGKNMKFRAENLGDKEFKKDYNIKYAYLCGGMYKAVASKEMVVKLGKANMMGYLGTGGVSKDKIEEDIKYIKQNLDNKYSYGVNLVHNIINPIEEEKLIDLCIKYEVKNLEAAAFMQMTPALVKYRLQGLKKDNQGNIEIKNRIMGKMSRPEIAKLFLSPAPDKIIEKLKQEGKITDEEASLAKEIPMADDICVESDSGGHTDQGVAYVLTPAIMRLRDEMMKQYGYKKRIRVGSGGGIGTPEAGLAAFVMGSDFILTGSINQCTVEAGTSDIVKEMLQGIEVQDTAYAPAGDMFEIGAKVQVLKKGTFFAARANKLYELYKQFNSIDEIDEKTKIQIQEKYCKRSFDDIWKDCEEYYSINVPHELEKAKQNPKTKMALIFRWYFGYSSRLALTGNIENKVDYQVYCGPSLGAFNQWVKGTELEDWKKRHVDVIGTKLMESTAELFEQRMKN
jgi:trans-AT polyketide synthase, acyltransferase and oxidoreductase domains